MITSHTDLRVRQNYGYNSRFLRDIPVASAFYGALGHFRAATDSVARAEDGGLAVGASCGPRRRRRSAGARRRRSDPGDWGVLIGAALLGDVRGFDPDAENGDLVFRLPRISMAWRDFRRHLATECPV